MNAKGTAPLAGSWAKFFTKLNILIPYNLAIVLLVIYSKGLKFIAPQKYTHGYLFRIAILGRNADVLQKVNMQIVV